MTHARANSGRAGKRQMATTPGASLPLDASLLLIVANLEGLDLKGFAPSMARPFGWRSARPSFTLALDESAAYRSSPMRSAISTNRPKDSSLWERGRQRSFRAPRASDARGLGFEGRRAARARMEGQARADHDLGRGLRLEWSDLRQPVQIAKVMTGTNWNGHRFFGLRQGKTLVANKDRGRRRKTGG